LAVVYLRCFCFVGRLGWWCLKGDKEGASGWDKWMDKSGGERRMGEKILG